MITNYIPKNCEDCQYHSVDEETIGDFGEKMVMQNLCSLLPEGENISREEPEGIGDNCPLTNKGDK